jgi:chromosome partitioning protein
MNIVETGELGIKLVPADPRLSVVTVEKMPTTNNISENTRSLWRHLSLLDSMIKPIRDDFDYILIDSHPDVNDLLRTIIYACDFVCSPVKLDLQSTIGVVSIMEAIDNVNADVELVANATREEIDHEPTKYAGAIATQAREWGGLLKWTEMTEYRRIGRDAPVFKAYVTEGDGLRQAARDRCPVFDVGGQNAGSKPRNYGASQRSLSNDARHEARCRCPPSYSLAGCCRGQGRFAGESPVHRRGTRPNGATFRNRCGKEGDSQGVDR